MFLPSLLTFALAADDGAAWLARVDAAANRGKDAHLVLSISVTDRTGTTADRVLEVWQKGSDKRLVRFTAPARLAGTGLLVPDGDTVYLYLPSYGRARRVVGESRGDAFMGTDFSLEDLSRLTYAGEYRATVEADEGALTRLSLAPLDASAHRDAAVRLWVRESDDMVEKIEHVDSAGRVTRRVTFSDFKTVSSRPIAHLLVAEDLVNNKKTVATVMRSELDSGLADDRFTLTELTRQ
ncbi:MAG: outer membrane lipoprotein-sorting protein [Deltaproteobacteria bacterium]|nr:outer membrane lipoprotein-sorting protein [Deltaproteobacteria bacterium]